MDEIWLPLTEYNGKQLRPFYLVSNQGRLKSAAHVASVHYKRGLVNRNIPEIILSPNSNNAGYLQCALLTSSGTILNVPIHRAVAATFCKNDDTASKTFVNHIDADKHNNSAYNLEWCTPAENSKHASSAGLNLLPDPRTPVKRLETGEIFDSLSAASIAMGRWYGYASEKLSKGQVCKDKNEEIWTLVADASLADVTQSAYRQRVNSAISASKHLHPKQLFKLS